MTRDEIIRIAEEEDLEFIRLQFTDLFGRFKNIAVTESQLERVLNNQCMFDGASVDGFVQVEESDLYLHPDLNSFEILPWRPQQGKVARMICDVHRPDGSPFPGDPRHILKRAVQKAEELGYHFYVGPECEFFLFRMNEDGVPQLHETDRAGYFDIEHQDSGEEIRRDIILNLERMGYELEASHHEAAPSQHEIDFKYADALSAADEIMTFRMAAKILARRKGLHASFMPKPLAGVNGSGMHINMSLADSKGQNLFADPKDPNGLSVLAYRFMAGILAHIKEILVLTNPVVNSYKRLIPGYDAPVAIAWSAQSNRSQLIRIPSQRGEETRIELRCPDSAANPYIALAACLMAGLDGIEKKMEPPKSIGRNLFLLNREELLSLGVEALPQTLGEALAEFEKSAFAKEILGEHAYGKYLKEKREEWRRYRSSVSDWELEEYLYKV